MQGRRYNISEYGAASLLVLGIVLFTMGDVDTLPTFNPKGIMLITIALFLDSVGTPPHSRPRRNPLNHFVTPALKRT